MNDRVELYKNEFKGKNTDEILKKTIEIFGYENVLLASSLGAEDQILTEKILKINRMARIFTLDTGRLFPETYKLIQQTMDKFNFSYEIYFPDYKDIEEITSLYGHDFFYKSVENRKKCCEIRKIKPLKRVLKTAKAWICGLRQEQSDNRSEIGAIEWDEGNGLFKINPLFDWDKEKVWNYIREKKIPYNPLHDKNYPSIGCEPCTSKVTDGENERAGRWRWENEDKKECGLHFENGKIVRSK